MDKYAISVKDGRVFEAIADASKEGQISIGDVSARQFTIDNSQLPELFDILKVRGREVQIKYRPQTNKIIILPPSVPEGRFKSSIGRKSSSFKRKRGSSSPIRSLGATHDRQSSAR